MEFIEVLTGVSNRFDKGYNLSAPDGKALRDGIVHILERLKALEERLPKEEKDKKTKGKEK